MANFYPSDEHLDKAGQEEAVKQRDKSTKEQEKAKRSDKSKDVPAPAPPDQNPSNNGSFR